MNKSQLIGGVIETVITDEELHLAQESEEPEEIPAHPVIMNKSIMTAYTRAKKASIAQNTPATKS